MGISALILTFISFVVFALWPRYVDATVSATHWTSTVTVEKYQSVDMSGWSPSNNAENVSKEGMRIHHYDKVQVGSKTINYTEQYVCGQDCRPVPESCYTTPRSCSDNNNGTKTCSGGDRVCTGGGQTCQTKYCSRNATRQEPVYENQPRYKMWYSWNEWQWVYNRTIKRTGTDLNPLLPTDQQINLNKNCFGRQKERFNNKWVFATTFFDGKNTLHTTLIPKMNLKTYLLTQIKHLK